MGLEDFPMVKKPTYEELERRVKELESEATLRKRAEEALRENEERFRAFMENYPAHIYIKDEAGRHIYGNRAALEIADMRMDEFIGSTSHDIFTADIARKLEETDRFVRTEKVAREIEFETRTPDGKVQWIKDVKFPIHLSPDKTLLGGIALDITDRKRAEERLRQNEKQLRLMADSLPAFISYVDAEQRYRFNNIAYEKLFGISRDDIVGHHIREILGDQVYESIRGYVEMALAGEEVKYETDLAMEDGTIRYMAVTYVPHFSEEGKPLGFYSLAEDVTDRRQAEEETRRHREALFHVDRVATMGELTASLAHELNQPLSAIVSNAQAAQRFLATDPPDLDEVRDILSDIVNDGSRASEVIGRLRTFLKRDVPDYHPLDLNEVIRDVITLVAKDAVIRNVSIVTELGADLPPALGDRIQLQQVLLNLISNGTDAMMNFDDDARRLIIRTEKDDQQSVKVTVRDFGVGLDEEDIGRVFEPFTTTKSDGMGMGLSISRTIIETHGGRIWATNNPDRGATFSFTLPACKNKK
jgi:PAS domain S-box-containing protein